MQARQGEKKKARQQRATERSAENGADRGRVSEKKFHQSGTQHSSTPTLKPPLECHPRRNRTSPLVAGGRSLGGAQFQFRQQPPRSCEKKVFDLGPLATRISILCIRPRRNCCKFVFSDECILKSRRAAGNSPLRSSSASEQDRAAKHPIARLAESRISRERSAGDARIFRHSSGTKRFCATAPHGPFGSTLPLLISSQLSLFLTRTCFAFTLD